jgi:hypothetical protein
MSEPENLQTALRPEMNWFYAVPSMQVTGDSVYFSYSDPSITTAVVTNFTRALADDVNLVLRQFSSLQTFYGMNPAIIAWIEEFIEGQMPPEQAMARASYATAILVSGMSDFSYNLNEHIGRIPEDVTEIPVPVSPLHLFGVYFCAVSLKDYLLPRAIEAGSTFFGTIEETTEAVTRAMVALAQTREEFSGPAHPTLNLTTRFLELSREQQQKESALTS